MAFAVERNVRHAWRILKVGTHAIEGAAQIERNLAFDFAVLDIALGTKRRAEGIRRKSDRRGPGF